MSEILENAKQGKNKFFIQFGGQGAPYLKELTALYKTEGMSRFFETSLGAVEKAVKIAGDSPALPFPVELKKWLENPETQPKDEYIAGISLGLILVAQFAHYENLNLMGFQRDDMLKATVGFSGHSQGLIAASFAALQLKGDEYYMGLDKYIQYLFLMGVRAQEVHPTIYPSERESDESLQLGAKGPAPMVAVLGANHETIEKMVQEINNELPDDKKIFVSLYNTPTNRILSSFRSSLIAFHKKFNDQLKEKEIKFVYLRTTCPFHSRLMEPIKEKFAKDIKAIDFNYKGSDLKGPVISFADGADLGKVENLGMRMCEDLMINPLYWDKSMRQATDKSITQILDFGPGKVSQRLSQDTLKAMDCETPVYAVAFARDLKNLTS